MRREEEGRAKNRGKGKDGGGADRLSSEPAI
jgi:hypothetical protein